VQKRTKVFFLILLLIPCWVIAAQYNIDLVNLHGTALMLLKTPAQVYESHDGLGRWFYGPFSLVLIQPLGHFTFIAVKIFWIALQTLCFFAVWRLLGRLFPFLEQRTVRWGWLFIWALAINPIHNNFQSNNIQMMLAAVLLYAELLAETENGLAQFFAGFLCALTAAIKVFPLFLCAFYFVTRSRALKLGLLAGLAFSVLLPFAFFGPEVAGAQFHGFFHNLATYHEDNSPIKIRDILCLPSMLSRWLTPEAVAQATGQASVEAQWVVRAVVVLLSGLFLVSAWRGSRAVTSANDRSRTYWWALAMAMMTFLNPSTRPHYFIFYLPAYCAVLDMLYQQSAQTLLKVGVILSAILVALTTQGVLGKALSFQAEMHSLPTMGALILCLGLALAVTRRNVTYVRAWRA
jgi:hypothetical protein